MMKTALIYVLATSFMLGGLAFAESADSLKKFETTEATVAPLTATWESDTVCVYARDSWTLKVTYLRKGTRSEGQDGQLLKEGVVVEGETVAETKKTSLGEMKYYGADRKSLWSLTGWNFSDRRRVKPSKLVPVKPSAEAKAELPKVKSTCCSGCAAKK
jgi:hypothetical protein